MEDTGVGVSVDGLTAKSKGVTTVEIGDTGVDVTANARPTARDSINTARTRLGSFSESISQPP